MDSTHRHETARAEKSRAALDREGDLLRGAVNGIQDALCVLDEFRGDSGASGGGTAVEEDVRLLREIRSRLEGRAGATDEPGFDE